MQSTTQAAELFVKSEKITAELASTGALGKWLGGVSDGETSCFVSCQLITIHRVSLGIAFVVQFCAERGIKA